MSHQRCHHASFSHWWAFVGPWVQPVCSGLGLQEVGAGSRWRLQRSQRWSSQQRGGSKLCFVGKTLPPLQAFESLSVMNLQPTSYQPGAVYIACSPQPSVNFTTSEQMKSPHLLIPGGGDALDPFHCSALFCCPMFSLPLRKWLRAAPTLPSLLASLSPHTALVPASSILQTI